MAQKTVAVIELITKLPAGEEQFLMNLLTWRKTRAAAIATIGTAEFAWLVT